eukprot:318171_1
MDEDEEDVVEEVVEEGTTVDEAVEEVEGAVDGFRLEGGELFDEEERRWSELLILTAVLEEAQQRWESIHCRERDRLMERLASIGDEFKRELEQLGDADEKWKDWMVLNARIDDVWAILKAKERVLRVEQRKRKMLKEIGTRDKVAKREDRLLKEKMMAQNKKRKDMELKAEKLESEQRMKQYVLKRQQAEIAE